MPAATDHSAFSACRPRSATCGITSSRTRPSTSMWMPSSTCVDAERAAERAQAVDRQGGALDAAQQRRAVQRVQEREGADVVATGLAAEQLRVALDAVEQRGREARSHFDAGGAHVLGEDRRGRAVRGADVADHGVVAAALGVVVDHDVHREHARGRALAEDGRLHVHQREPVELLQLGRRDDANLDAERRDHRAVLGSLHRAERDQRRGGTLAAEQRRAARCPTRCRRDPGSGCNRIPTFSRDASSSRSSTTRWRFSRWSNSSSKSSRISERRRPRRRHGWIGRSPESSLSESTRIGAIGTASPTTPTAVRTKPISSLTMQKTSPSRGSSLRDRLGREPALQRAKAGRPHAWLVVARNPGEFLVLAGADASPEPSQLGSVAHDDAAFHTISRRPAHEPAAAGILAAASIPAATPHSGWVPGSARGDGAVRGPVLTGAGARSAERLEPPSPWRPCSPPCRSARASTRW